MVAGSPSVGTVSFYLGSVAQGNQIGSAVNVSGGSATSAATNNLAPGSNTIIAVYSGGTGFTGSQGNASVIQIATLTWNAGANGNWTAAHWSGTGPTNPNANANAIVNTPYIIQVTSAQAANSLSISQGGQVAVTASGSLTVTNTTSVSAGSLTVAPGGVFTTGWTLGLDGSGSISGGSVSAAAYLFNNGAVSANLSGAGGLTKDTSGTVILSGTNSYGGGTTVLAGTLVASKSSSLADGSNLSIGANAGSAFGGVVTAPIVPATAPAVSLALALPMPPESQVAGSTAASPSASGLAAKKSSIATASSVASSSPMIAAARDAVLRSGIVRRTVPFASIAWYQAIDEQNKRRAGSAEPDAIRLDRLLADSGF
jgi:autotransporter-associated beta strand protein